MARRLHLGNLWKYLQLELVQIPTALPCAMFICLNFWAVQGFEKGTSMKRACKNYFYINTQEKHDGYSIK
jgi:hypothetical protein